jgi:hypothetical protein
MQGTTLSDFSHSEIVKKSMGTEDRQIQLSSQELCNCLAKADYINSRTVARSLSPPGVTYHWRSATPESRESADETRFKAPEDGALERMDQEDEDYEA